MRVEKRSGELEIFDRNRIENAIYQAFKREIELGSPDIIGHLAEDIEKQCYDAINIENIQDLVEQALMQQHPNVAKRYIKYREKRRETRSQSQIIKESINGIINIENNDLTKENANMAAHTPAGQMMQIASLSSKDYALNYLLSEPHAKLHEDGYIHIHDLDYYASKTTTCVQYGLDNLYKNGFATKNGKIKTPQSIETYATLATIIFQTNQNEQHGGQAIPAFDFFMASGVLKSFKKNFTKILDEFIQITDNKLSCNLKEIVDVSIKKIDDIDMAAIRQALTLDIDLEKITKIAYEQTDSDTYQAMQGVIFNLNTMHSRGGNQVVFSSINYGTDTSEEGRMVIRNILKATKAGLGNGETPIFPIQIFKVKKGVNYSNEDLQKAANTSVWDEAFLNSDFCDKNFDLFLQSIKTNATSLFPNYLFLDAPFNYHEKWDINDPQRYKYEVATMGCRTRVFENLHGEKSSIGRGNISFTTINIVRLAIEVAQEYDDVEQRKELFKQRVLDMADIVAEQLLERLEYQKTALIMQYPFMMTNDIWRGGCKKKSAQQVGDILNSGTLGIGFIGGHNAMVALFGQGHGESEDVRAYFYDVILAMSDKVQKLKDKHQLNFSLLATPAEGLSGRFTRLDKQAYGIIEGVNDRDYYVNSFHVDVKGKVNAFDKIRIEAPFHGLTTGGHITYIEVDGEAKKNPQALLKIIETMYDNNIGYGSINHPVDQCGECNYHGIIYAKCPKCASQNIRRIRRITGYLTGDLSSWNGAKKAEEKDRVKHL
ncbi:MAG: anaerobic ribonucleoside triphosphate reductase [Alphaproteobacteria bacterium]